ncbi:MAG: glycosyltransferase family 4 protein [Candidatus Hodarchaeota archaeon]
MKILFISLFSFVIGLVSANTISKFGFRLGLIDVPSERSAHDNPIPKAGGIGIPIAFGITAFLFYKLNLILVSTAIILSIVALFNDKIGIPISFRLILEFTLGLIIVLVYKEELINLIHNNYGALVMLFMVAFLTIFIVATTNFFNFMDGINGIGGFEAIISFSFLGIFALYFKRSPEILLIVFSVLASCAGFLLLNFPKAKVFMGDVGSIFIGFLFAGMVVFLTKSLKEFLLLASFQSVFYIDCISTIFLRLMKRENILKAHKNHLYQKLVHHSGWTHSKVVLYFGLAQVLIGIFSLILFRLNIVFLIIFWLSLLTAYWTILISSKLIRYEET